MKSFKYGSLISDICLISDIFLISDICFLCGFIVFCSSIFSSHLCHRLSLLSPVISVCVMTLDLLITIYWFFCWSGDLSWNLDSPLSCELASMCLWSHMSGKQTGRTQWCQHEGCMKHHNHLGQLVHSP